MLDNIPLPNRDFISLYKHEFESSLLSDRIECLIVHGSSLYKPFINEFSDIDLELILKKPKKNDYHIIKCIIKKNTIPTECQLRYLNEISDIKGTIYQTKYKIFMYYAYSNGLCLIGNNVYQKLIKNLSGKTVKQSLLITIQISYKDIRKSFFADANPYIINKNIIRTLFDVSLYLGLVDYKTLGTKETFQLEATSCIQLLKIFYNTILLPSDIQKLEIFQQKYLKIELFQDILPVIDKIISNITTTHSTYHKYN